MCRTPLPKKQVPTYLLDLSARVDFVRQDEAVTLWSCDHKADAD